MRIRKRRLAPVSLLAAGAALLCAGRMCAQGTAPAPTTYSKMMVARTVPVPDFHGKTLQQVQAQVGGLMPGSRSRMFAGIDSQGPADGVVASQNPVVNTPVVPGATRLLLTLETPQPSGFSAFLGKLAAGMAAQKTADEQKMVIVPDLQGDTRMVAQRYLEAARLRVRFTGNEEGVVAQQYPVARSSVRAGTQVIVTMALPPVLVPPLFGLTLPDAIRKLQAASLQDGGVSGDSGEGSTVVAQSIGAGAQVPRGTVVDVTMRAAPVPVPPPATDSAVAPVQVEQPLTPVKVSVPPLTTMTGAKAEAALSGVGLRIGPWKSPPTWLVRTQTPVAGIEVDAGSEVDVTLAAPTVVVPDVGRESETAARSALKSFGLEPRISYALNGDMTSPHIVVGQTPAASTVVDEGSMVDVVIGVDPPPPSAVQRVWTAIKVAAPLAPWWVWLAIGLPIGGVGMRLVGRGGRSPRLPEPNHTTVPAASAVCTLAPAQPDGRVRLKGPAGPGLRFKITLQDRVGRGVIRTDSEPAVTRKG